MNKDRGAYIDEMGDFPGDSEVKLPPQVKGKLEYHSTPAPLEADKELERLLGIFEDDVVEWADGNMKSGVFKKRRGQAKTALLAWRDSHTVAELENLPIGKTPTIQNQVIRDRINQLKEGAKDD